MTSINTSRALPQKVNEFTKATPCKMIEFAKTTPSKKYKTLNEIAFEPHTV